MNTQQLKGHITRQAIAYDFLDMDDEQEGISYSLGEHDVEDYEWEEFESTDILMECSDNHYISADF